MEKLTSDQLISPAAEPMRTNRWLFTFAGIDSWTILTFERPGGEFGEIQIDYINTVRFFQGKWKPKPSAMTLWDPLVPAASQKIEEWVRLGYEQPTGRAGYKEFYAGKNVQLKMLDPAGSVIQRYDYYNFFITDYSYGALTYEGAEKQVININYRYDNVLMMY